MVPDLRGVFLRGVDAGKGYDPGRKLGSYQDENIGKHSHKLPNDDNSRWRYITDCNLSAKKENYDEGFRYQGDGVTAVNDATNKENRPRNIAVTYIIKY